MQLKLGKMTSKELAQWFNVTSKTYQNNNSKYLDKLSDFCQFEKVYGGVIVQEIYVSKYDKLWRKKADQFYLEEISRCVEEQDGLATLAGIARKMVNEGKFESESTAKRQLTKSGDRLFGQIKDLHGKGIAGVRERLWAIKVDDYNKYRLMTAEEEERFDKIIESLYCTNAERVKRAALLEETYRADKDMTKEEYFEQKERLGLNVFKDCIFQFGNETGLTIVHCTKHDFMNKFDISEEDRAYLESLQN